MSTANLRKPGDTEEIYFDGHPSPAANAGQLITVLALEIVLIAAGVWALVAGHGPWLLIGCLLLSTAALAVIILSTRFTRYRITNYRVDYEHGILTRRSDTLELWHVDDISLRQTLLDRILNVGRIIIQCDDRSTPTLELIGLPNPRPLFDTLKARIIAVKRQRGVIKMDEGT